MARRRGQRNEWGPLSVGEAIILALIAFVVTAVTIPASVAMRQRSDRDAARAQVRRAVHALESYREDHGTYARVVPATLARYDASLKPSRIRVVSASDWTYCVEASSGTHTWHQSGPYGSIARGAC